MRWRLIVLGLLVANIVVVALRVLAPPPAPPARDLPPLPAGPGVMLVGEVMPPGSNSDTDLCFTIGPLATVLQQRRAEDSLRPFASVLRARESNADRDRGWWVYLPPETSRQAALSRARELADRGVEDFYVVTSGDMENTVSLGLYESQENARRRQARIRAMGFNAQMAVRREEAPQYWVDYHLPPGQRSPWRFILRASPGAQHLEIPCFEVEAGETSPGGDQRL